MGDFTIRHLSQVSIINKVISTVTLTVRDDFHGIFHGPLFMNEINLTQPAPTGPIKDCNVFRVPDHAFPFFPLVLFHFLLCNSFPQHSDQTPLTQVV